MKKYRIFCLLMTMVLLIGPLVGRASSLSSEIKKTANKIDDLEEKKEAAEETVGQLQSQENGLQGELKDLNTQMSQVSNQISELEQQIIGKQAEIEQTEEDLKKAERKKETQYANMKQRIQFIYENGSINIIEVLLSSSSMGDFLNKAEYVAEVNSYDSQMLTRYEETCVEVETKGILLKEEKENLLTLQDEMQQKKTELDGLISSTKGSIAQKQEEISQAQDAVEDFEAQIEKMKAYEEELERKKAEEARKQAEEEARRRKEEAGKTQTGGGTVSANAGDLALLAALVECEAGGESYDGQLAVASVVVNRVKSPRFPNSISGVIYQSGQFSPVASGRFAIVLARGANASCVQAANAALSGNTNVSSLFFCRASAGVPGTVIGNHVFY